MNSTLLILTVNYKLQVYVLAPKPQFLAQISKVHFTIHFCAPLEINLFFKHYNQLNQSCSDKSYPFYFI